MAKITFENLRDEVDTYSEQISKSVRWACIGVIGALWTMLNSEQVTLDPDKNISYWVLGSYSLTELIAATFALSVLSLALDAAQFVCGYISNFIGMGNHNESFEYTKQYLGRFGLSMYIGMFVFFFLKVVAAIPIALTFIGICVSLDLSK